MCLLYRKASLHAVQNKLLTSSQWLDFMFKTWKVQSRLSGFLKTCDYLLLTELSGKVILVFWRNQMHQTWIQTQNTVKIKKKATLPLSLPQQASLNSQIVRPVVFIIIIISHVCKNSTVRCYQFVTMAWKHQIYCTNLSLLSHFLTYSHKRPD